MYARAWLLALPLSLTFIGGGRAADGEDNQPVPHPFCQNILGDLGKSIVTLKCSSGRNLFILPDNFNVTHVHPIITHVIFNGGVVLHHGVTSLPERPTLRSVQLYQFNEADTNPRFPVDTFFTNIKSHLKSIFLERVKLLYLQSTDLEGFVGLESLRLVQVQVDVLGADIFQSLMPDTASLPVLSNLEISRGTIRAMDWSFLRPISKSLRTLNLDRLNLTASVWHCSGSGFKLEKATTLSLIHNNLEQIPQCFVNSLSATALEELHLQTPLSAFCPSSSKCDCCDLSSLAAWLRRFNLLQVTRVITCGKEKKHFSGFPTKTAFEANCPKPTTARRTIATTKAPLLTRITSTNSPPTSSLAHSSVTYSPDSPTQASSTRPSTATSTETIASTKWTSTISITDHSVISSVITRSSSTNSATTTVLPLPSGSSSTKIKLKKPSHYYSAAFIFRIKLNKPIFRSFGAGFYNSTF
ncbi:hypothetical protein BV898_06043 [Hypsibius exemplaris]|uniref:LRRCT domain-containing protein n=1 Tax=Hypsibius exemplaris TaxID=2072580 RepID=A0A1W0WY45_HYPEX|nr:hypothetical protein BV898_06043 [Hypsibius exemplaris]